MKLRPAWGSKMSSVNGLYFKLCKKIESGLTCMRQGIRSDHPCDLFILSPPNYYLQKASCRAQEVTSSSFWACVYVYAYALVCVMSLSKSWLHGALTQVPGWSENCAKLFQNWMNAKKCHNNWEVYLQWCTIQASTQFCRVYHFVKSISQWHTQMERKVVHFGNTTVQIWSWSIFSPQPKYREGLYVYNLFNHRPRSP